MKNYVMSKKKKTENKQHKAKPTFQPPLSKFTLLL